MAISSGSLAYEVSCAPAKAAGRTFTLEELEEALLEPVAGLVFDASGIAEISTMLSALAETSFEETGVTEILKQPREVEDWRVGEALAEGYLCEHRACEFPWPDGRDERRANSSLPGADLVGFQQTASGYRLAFGEVKTSSQDVRPPNVLFGRSGLIAQLEYLRDRVEARQRLIRYLAFRARGATWRASFESAVRTYLNDCLDFVMFGFLVRDTSPHEDDLKARAKALKAKCSPPTGVELISLYLPSNEIKNLGSRVAKVASASGALS